MLPLVLLLQASSIEPLNLTCFGGGTANKPLVINGNGSHSGSGMVGTTPYSYSGNGNATVVGQRQQGFGDQVDLRLFAGDDRVRMPRTMLPPIHGGSGGWFKLKNVVVDARSIRASVAVGLLNNPKLFIDRATGSISISGKAGDYAGMCEAVNAETPTKF